MGAGEISVRYPCFLCKDREKRGSRERRGATRFVA
jgi:hypothetical protein